MRVVLERVSQTLIAVGNLSDLVVTQLSTVIAMGRNTDATIIEMRGEMQEMCAQMTEMKRNFAANGVPAATPEPALAPLGHPGAGWELPATTVLQLQGLNNKLRSASYRRQLVIVVHN